MNRKALLACVTFVAMVGVVLMMVPFISSMQPNEKARASLPAIDVSELKVGEPALRSHPTFGRYREYEWSILFLRQADGQLKAWDVLTQNDVVMMPDVHWWRPGYPCRHFRLSSPASNELAYWECQDSVDEIGEWSAQQWQWSQDGKNLGGSYFDDMQPTVGTLKGKHFVVGERAVAKAR